MRDFFFPTSFRALSLPVFRLHLWARGKQPRRRGPGVHLQVGCSLTRLFSWEGQSRAAERTITLRALLLQETRELRAEPARLSDCAPAPWYSLGGGRSWGKRALTGSKRPVKPETREPHCPAAEGAQGCPGSGPSANRCGAQLLGLGWGQAWVLPCFSRPDPAARLSVARSWYSF